MPLYSRVLISTNKFSQSGRQCIIKRQKLPIKYVYHMLRYIWDKDQISFSPIFSCFSVHFTVISIILTLSVTVVTVSFASSPLHLYSSSLQVSYIYF